MKQECCTINEAIRLLMGAEKEVEGVNNPADCLMLTFPDKGAKIEIDYTDVLHRIVRVYGIDDDYASPKEWRDGEIVMDDIASQIINSWSLEPEKDALVFMMENHVRTLHIDYKQGDKHDIRIDTTARWSEEGMDPMVDGYCDGWLHIRYRNEEELKQIQQTMKKICLSLNFEENVSIL